MDDYSIIMVKAIADRWKGLFAMSEKKLFWLPKKSPMSSKLYLTPNICRLAEAFAEELHERVRRSSFGWSYNSADDLEEDHAKIADHDEDSYSADHHKDIYANNADHHEDNHDDSADHEDG